MASQPMTIAPLGGMSLAIDAMRTAIAACTSWQIWTGADRLASGQRAAAAAKKCFLYALPLSDDPNGYTAEELDRLRPWCGLSFIPPAIIGRQSAAYEQVRTANDHFVERSTLFIHVADTVDASVSQDDYWVLMNFTNQLGGLIDELSQNDTIVMQRISVVIEPHRCTEVMKGTQGDFVQSVLRIECGLNSGRR